MAHFPEHDAMHAHDALVGARVIDADGNQASIASIQQDGGEAQAWVQLADGTQVLVPISLLARQDQESGPAYRLPFSLHANENAHSQQMRFPVMEEGVQVTKRVVDTGRGVRVRKTVSEHEHLIDEPLLQDELTVEHVPIGRVVDESSPPQTRYEGDTLVVPVLEEVLVVQKQMRLKEEVRITRHRHAVQVPQSVVLRSEHVSVERFDEGRKQ